MTHVEFIVPDTEGMHDAVVRMEVIDENLNNNPVLLLDSLRTAITEWIKGTEDGRQAWRESCEDFNIGDLANNLGGDICGYLDRHGIGTIDISFVDRFDGNWTHDTVLADADDVDGHRGDA